MYRLLLPLAGTPELRAFADQALGNLLHDAPADKADTCSARCGRYFESNGNVAHTAKALFIHRNTLLYRLDRIRQAGRI